MKKYLGLFLVLAMALLVTTGAKAEDSAGVSAGSEVGADVNTGASMTPAQKAKLEAAKAAREKMQAGREKRQEASAKIRMEAEGKIKALRASFELEKDKNKAEIKKARIEGREKLLVNLDAAVQRMVNLEARINAQIVKLEAKGVAATDAKGFVATAEVKLGDAKVKIAEASALLSVSANELTADSKAKLKVLTKDIQTLIKDAHKALNDSIKSLKDAVKLKIETRVDAKAGTSATTP
ncbi:hypothetical protein A2W12_02840 [Candidatus Nomurabacteria bacterium RBG_16_40_11]|nr:MAG: hypothetical protein A2W12_02840 [Candidatus Nomurabacteria bacterium RBG_16_40_11]